MDSIKNILCYLSIIWRSKWIVISQVVLFTAIGVIVAWKMPSFYRSETLILVEKQQIPESYVTPTDRTPFSQRLSTISQQILSRQNIEKIVNDYQLYRGKSTSPFSRLLGYFREERPPSRDEIIERMTRDVEVRVIGGRSGDAFSVSFIGTNPEVTMHVTNTLASLFIDENLKSREEYAEGTSDFISTELENARRELETQESALRGFKERNMGSLPQQLDANLRTLDRLQSELQSVKNEIRNSEDRRGVLEGQLGRNSVTLPGMPANPLQTELEALQRDLAALLARYNENYPDVIITRKKIAEVRERLASGRPEPSGAAAAAAQAEANPQAYNELMLLKSRIETLNARSAEIRKQIQDYERRVETTPASEQRFIDLRRDYDISLANYQALLEKKMNAKLAENLEKRQKGERFRVINSANLPEKPFRPNKTAIVAAGGALGTGIGVGIILLMEFMSPSFRTRDELAEAIDMPILATVPAFAAAPPGKERKISFRSLKRKNGHT